MHFSVVIPCYNEEAYIGNLLASLDAQVFDRAKFEVIVVDNNSLDKTAQAVWDYAATSSMNIRLVHEYTPGVSISRNSGARISHGRTLVFLDADNMLDNRFLSGLFGYMSDKDCNSGSIRTMPDKFNIKGWLVFMILEIIKMVLPKPFGKSFVDRKIFTQVDGFNENIVLGENVEFLVKVKALIKKNGGRFGHCKMGVKCSLRRFEKVGYINVLMPWLMAYIGIYSQEYKTMAELERN